MGAACECHDDDATAPLPIESNCFVIMFTLPRSAEGNVSVVVSGTSSVIGNDAKFGGGINLKDLSSVLVGGQASVSHNAASENGGGVRLGPDNRLTMSGSGSVRHNRALVSGGGISLDGGTAHFADEVSLSSNFAGERGGGIHLANGSSMVARDASVITDNVAASGAGIAIQSQVQRSASVSRAAIRKRRLMSRTYASLSPSHTGHCLPARQDHDCRLHRNVSRGCRARRGFRLGTSRCGSRFELLIERRRRVVSLINRATGGNAICHRSEPNRLGQVCNRGVSRPHARFGRCCK
jgi:hypothetical protein